MDQVRELLGLIKGIKMNGVLVVVSFIVRYTYPYKERAHAGFDFKGDTDGTWERSERLTKDDVLERVIGPFAPNASFSVSRRTRAFNCTNPPPQVTILIVLFVMLCIHNCCRAVN